jgi:hypothetical protein
MGRLGWEELYGCTRREYADKLSSALEEGHPSGRSGPRGPLLSICDCRAVRNGAAGALPCRGLAARANRFSGADLLRRSSPGDISIEASREHYQSGATCTCTGFTGFAELLEISWNQSDGSTAGSGILDIHRGLKPSLSILNAHDAFAVRYTAVRHDLKSCPDT